MSSELPIRIVGYEHDPTKRQQIPELGDIWQRVQQVVFDQHVVNCFEHRFREQQLNIARDGRLVMPSPFYEGTDSSTASYFCHEKFFYRFSSAEEYFWATTSAEQLLGALYFPQRMLAVCLYPPELDRYVLAEFGQLRADVVRPERVGLSAANTCALVVGIGQLTHMLWNHLSALQGALNAGIAQSLPVMMIYEPLGPTAEIFPELAPRLRQLPFSAVPGLNAEYSLLVGIGARTISRSLRKRVRQVAQRHAGETVLADRERFRSAHAPIFWMTLKPFDRTAHNQIDALAIIIGEIKRWYPNAGFLLDGASLPWDFTDNPNYDGFFRDYLDRQLQGSERLIAELIGRIDPEWRASVVALAGISACDEITWAAIADFYFCHAGTAHTKIGWVHETPGMIYANRQYTAHHRAMKPLEHEPPIYYLPANFVAEDPDEACGPEQLARRAQNFTLLAPSEIAQRLLDAFHEARHIGDPSLPGLVRP